MTRGGLPAGAALLALAILGATPANSQEDPWLAGAACLDLPDRTACWVRAARTVEHFPPDFEIGARPELAAELGLPAREPLPPMEGGSPYTEIARPGLEAFTGAVELALERARGESPERVLEALRALPVAEPPFAPNPVSDQVLAFGRLDAYALVLAGLNEQRPDVQEAIVRAWAADLPEDSSLILSSGADALADILARRGDFAAVDRALLTLTPENEPAAIRNLIRHGRLDAAWPVAQAATVEKRMAGAAQAYAAVARMMEPYHREVMRLVQAQVETMIAGLPSADRAEARRVLMEDMPTDPGDLGEPAMADGESAADMAREEVNQARAGLMHDAARAGRYDLAEPLARGLFEQTPDPRDERPLAWMAAALPVLARPGAEDAGTWMEAADRRAGAGDPRTMPLTALHDGWMRLGRTDRADALLARWCPFAERQAQARYDDGTGGGPQLLTDLGDAPVAVEFTQILVDRDDVAGAESMGPFFMPTMLILKDFDRGAGLSRLDERLAGRSEEAQRTMLVNCAIHGRSRRLLDEAETCTRRLIDRADGPRSRGAGVAQLLALATARAQAGEPTRAEALLTEALTMGIGLPDGRSPFTYDLATAMTEVGKARLREQGRLPAPGAS